MKAGKGSGKDLISLLGAVLGYGGLYDQFLQNACSAVKACFNCCASGREEEPMYRTVFDGRDDLISR